MSVISVRRKVKVDGKWQFLTVAKTGEKLDWTHLVHKGVRVVSTTGTFYLDYAQNGRRVRKAIGNHPKDAKVALHDQINVLALRKSGMEVADAPAITGRNPGTGPTIKSVIAAFKSTPPVKYRKRSIAKYRNALDSFGKWTSKTHLNQLDRLDIVHYMSYLVNIEKLHVSTAVDKAHIAHAIMNDSGAEIRMKRKGDWPKVTEQERQPYAPEVLEKLFAATTDYEFVLFQTFLQTGFRDQEVGFLAWSDFKRDKLSVSKKAALGFDPKSYEERTIPIPKMLTELLTKHRKTQDEDAYLIFGTSNFLAHQGRPGGQRDKHMLDVLKRLALRAEMNCGKCVTTIKGKEVTCQTRPVCKEFGLHKFRHTYATDHLHDGMDIVSLQLLLGHKDLESTKKYLKGLPSDELAAKVNRSSNATRYATTR